ncbi:hypothetical protein L596_005904 [Steinernema carpocapsae]|uniref:Uncharacterized protein n=1 Tax=Steinernema carpocapsae TaxID=34508 RepID=A0A4U8V220_STECR|nr:hypothetical protein L596_005904 [Steinernema carpocapsae]
MRNANNGQQLAAPWVRGHLASAPNKGRAEKRHLIVDFPPIKKATNCATANAGRTKRSLPRRRLFGCHRQAAVQNAGQGAKCICSF